jgi:hypothetical protein
MALLPFREQRDATSKASWRLSQPPNCKPNNKLRWLTALWRGYCPSSSTPARQRFQWLSFARATARELTAVWLALPKVLGAKPMQWAREDAAEVEFRLYRQPWQGYYTQGRIGTRPISAMPGQEGAVLF